MPKISRNDPCPCGSNKKYKHCCLSQARSPAPVRSEEHLAVRTALDWLAKHYSRQIFEAATTDFFDAKEETIKEKMARIPEHLQEMVHVNFNEWLLADAEFLLRGQKLRTMSLILGVGGPKLTPQGRKHLEVLSSSALSLYEVQEVHKGTGVLLIDLIDKKLPPIFVYEVRATKSLVQWDIIGSRCIQQDGEYSFSGGVYPFLRDAGVACLAQIKKLLRSRREETSVRSICTKEIITRWVNSITAPPIMPIILDYKTKELISFTTDYYAVFDWQALESILVAQEDITVEEEGSIWIHVESIDENHYRTRASLKRIVKKDRLRVECNTTGKADAARRWLEELAGNLVRHTSRRSATFNQMLRAQRKKESADSAQQEAIPHEMQQEIIREHLVRHYEEWPSIPLPALNGKTPLEAAKLKSLRPKLLNILKQIEQREARRSQQEGVQAVDLSFLRKCLNL